MDQNSNVNLKVVQCGFFYKTWTKNSKTPMVNLLKTLSHFKMTILKYDGKSIFWLFKMLVEIFWIEIWYFLFQICFRNQFWLRKVVKRKISKYAYLPIFSLTTSWSPKLIPKAELKWECPYFYFNFFCWKVLANILKVKKLISNCILKLLFWTGQRFSKTMGVLEFLVHIL